jgi:hypothetical protein|tara:strand:- start:728 stop:964 length:237 start_codon:yes stop_codon:yes gene_type:complete
MKELIDKQKALEAKESRIFKIYQVESANIRNEIILVQKELANVCEHKEFSRDNFIYAELYCKSCLLTKGEVMRLRHNS